MGEKVMTFEVVRGNDIVCSGGDFGCGQSSVTVEFFLNLVAGPSRGIVRRSSQCWCAYVEWIGGLGLMCW